MKHLASARSSICHFYCLGQSPLFRHIYLSGVPRLGAQFSIYPLELIRTRLAVCPPGTYRGISDCFARIVREEGWLAFYRGLTPSLVQRLCAPSTPAACDTAGFSES